MGNTSNNGDASGAFGCIIGILFISAIILAIIGLSTKPKQPKLNPHLQWADTTTVVVRSDSLIIE